MDNGKREKLIESIFGLVTYWIANPGDYINNEKDCDEELKDLLNQLAPSESQSVVDNEDEEKCCYDERNIRRGWNPHQPSYCEVCGKDV